MLERLIERSLSDIVQKWLLSDHSLKIKLFKGDVDLKDVRLNCDQLQQHLDAMENVDLPFAFKEISVGK